MLNEFTYCPRLFYYEHVEGLFEHNRETIEGALGHSRVDQREDDLPPPEQLAEAGQAVRARSVTLSSDTYGVIAKLDLLESDESASDSGGLQAAAGRARRPTGPSRPGTPTRSSWASRP